MWESISDLKLSTRRSSLFCKLLPAESRPAVSFSQVHAWPVHLVRVYRGERRHPSQRKVLLHLRSGRSPLVRSVPPKRINLTDQNGQLCDTRALCPPSSFSIDVASLSVLAVVYFVGRLDLESATRRQHSSDCPIAKRFNAGSRSIVQFCGGLGSSIPTHQTSPYAFIAQL